MSNQLKTITEKEKMQLHQALQNVQEKLLSLYRKEEEKAEVGYDRDLEYTFEEMGEK